MGGSNEWRVFSLNGLRLVNGINDFLLDRTKIVAKAIDKGLLEGLKVVIGRAMVRRCRARGDRVGRLSQGGVNCIAGS